MSHKRNPKGKKRKILEDHRKIGKRFVPPMLQDFNFQLVTFASQAIPEFLWLAMLNDKYGWKDGAHLGVEMAKLANELPEVEIDKNEPAPEKKMQGIFAMTSSFLALEMSQKGLLVERMKLSGIWEPIVEALGPIASLYPRFPLQFVFDGATVLPNGQDLETVKKVLLPLHDKYTREAVAMYGNAVYIAFATDRFKIVANDKKDNPMANFPALQEYPNTEESKMIAASVRASLLSLLGMSNISMDWALYFWNRGLELEPCQER